jgi:hypothetical protein
MKTYRTLFIVGLLLLTGSINNYRTDWIGIAKAGSISGQVLSVIDDRPIEGALVTVLKNGRTEASTRTDATGHFHIPGLRPQNYNVVAENYLHGSLMIESVPVKIGHEVTTHFILTPRYTIQ